MEGRILERFEIAGILETSVRVRVCGGDGVESSDSEFNSSSCWRPRRIDCVARSERRSKPQQPKRPELRVPRDPLHPEWLARASLLTLPYDGRELLADADEPDRLQCRPKRPCQAPWISHDRPFPAAIEADDDRGHACSAQRGVYLRGRRIHLSRTTNPGYRKQL